MPWGNTAHMWVREGNACALFLVTYSQFLKAGRLVAKRSWRLPAENRSCTHTDPVSPA